MKSTLKIPGISPVVSSLILHFLSVFGLAFVGQLIAGYTGTVHVSSVLALLTSAAAAGVTAVVHVVLGLMPTPPATGTWIRLANGTVMTPYGVSLKVKSSVHQLVVSVLVTFLTIFGAQLVGGAAHLVSLPDVTALLIAAVTAAIAGVVQFLAGLVPAPKPAV